jgi:bleomycin hydrolase
MNQTTITPELLATMGQRYAAQPELEVLSGILSNTPLNSAAFLPAKAAQLRMDFSIEVPTTGITNQKQSGRCWLFSTMNLLRERVIRKYKLEQFTLSGSYLAFYDKLEKANSFFQSILHFAGDPLDSRENLFLLENCLSDGGQWDMAVSLIEKYGVVPAWVMPETIHAEHTDDWTQLLQHKLREDALELRAMVAQGRDPGPRQTEMLQEIYNALCILYGQPPATFDWCYRDKDKEYHCHRDLTPLTFYRNFVGDDLRDYVSIISAPDHDFGRLYSQPFMSNLVEGHIHFLNLPMDELEALAIAQLKSGEGVYFACDCHPDRALKQGYWDQESFQYGAVLGGMTFGATKAQRLATHDSLMNHAMFLCGVNLTEAGVPDRWKIENSWGDEKGQKGYFVCSEHWFQEYAMQAIVRKSFLSETQLALLEQEPIPMPFWDPLI